MKLEVKGLQIRGAFSHVQFWHLLLDDVALARKQMAATGLFARPVHANPSTSQSLQDLGWDFRPQYSKTHVSLQEVSAILCNDKIHGCPDILQVNPILSL